MSASVDRELHVVQRRAMLHPSIEVITRPSCRNGAPTRDTGVLAEDCQQEANKMLGKASIAIATGVLIISGSGSTGGGTAVAQEAGFRCTEATIRGTYGGQMQGTNPVPPPQGGGTQSVIGVIVRTYDGAGGFTQVDNIKGSVTGIVPDRPGSGTYQVNADCSGITLFQPGPGITLEERMVIVDHGNEIRTIVSSPLAVMASSVQKRIDHR
jgi:hypothetical protein